MRRSFAILLVAVLGAIGSAASATAQTTIQLPTFNYTTVTTTVLVPDQGAAYLGGVNRAQDGRSQFGVPLLSKLPGVGRPFNNVGIGQTRGATGLSVRAQIHDFEAMDQMLLGQAAAQQGSAVAGPSGRLPGAMAGGAPMTSVADAQRSRAEEVDSQKLELSNLLQRAQTAEADGKPNVAKIYYRIVARDAREPDLRAIAQEHLAALSSHGSAKVAVVAAPR